MDFRRLQPGMTLYKTIARSNKTVSYHAIDIIFIRAKNDEKVTCDMVSVYEFGGLTKAREVFSWTRNSQEWSGHWTGHPSLINERMMRETLAACFGEWVQ